VRAPDAVATTRQLVEDINAASPVSGIRSVVADPLLLDGEVVIETQKGRVHVGVRQQLGRLQVGLASMRL
jgi:flagellar biosynthesis/type III secretory pathway protein FliH